MSRHRTPWCVVVALFVLALVTGSRPAAAAPPDPGQGTKDWLRLVSGEWLTGELKFMRNEDLEFDSDKLDLLKLKWEDVLELHVSRPLTYAFSDDRHATGPAMIRDSVVLVTANGQQQQFLRRDLLSIIAANQGSEIHLWSGNASLGFVGRSGNTDQIDSNALAFLRRDGLRTRTDLRYAGNFGKLAGVRSVNNQLGSGRLDLFLSRNLFVTPLSLELYSDEFQNLDLRTTVSAGAGVYLIKLNGLEWFVQIGAGYLSTRYRSVAPGQDQSISSAAVIPMTALEWEPEKDVTINVDYNATLSVPEVKNAFHHLVAMLTLENLKVVDLNASVTWDHVANPQPRSDATVPQKDDLRTAFGIGIDF